VALTLAAARRAVAAERCECVTECKVFRHFRAAVVRADTGGGVGPTTAVPAVDVARGATATRGLPGTGAATREATETSLVRTYRQRVMADGTQTDESVAEHVSAELGPDLAAVVCTGSLTPQHRQALLDRVDLALDARASFVAVLDREDASLEAVETACQRVRAELRRARAWETAPTSAGFDATFDAALAAWDRLDDLAAVLDAAADDRQATLASHRRSLTTVDADVTEYLYEGRPGLAAIASVGRDLDTGRRAVTRTVGRADDTQPPGW